jgi:acetyltransferase-like isoleucine patch superfamily enzyme
MKKKIHNKRIDIVAIIFIGLLPSFIKKIIYRFKGYKIGKNVRISFGSVLIVKNNCRIDSGVKFGYFSYIRANTACFGKNSLIRSLCFIDVPEIIIGQEVIISEFTTIRSQLASSKSRIELRDKVHIFPHCLLDPSCRLLIDAESAVGFNSSIFTHGSYKNILDGYKVVFGDVNIGKRVELAYNVFVAPGISIGDDVIVGYGSYVNQDLPAGVLAAGIPAKVKRYKEQFVTAPVYLDKIKILESILKDFKEHLYFTFSIQSEFKDLCLQINLDQSPRHIFISTDDSELNLNKRDIIISIRENNSQHYDSLMNKKTNWFDCNDYVCRIHNDDELAIEFRNFLERYGIRFLQK